MGVGAFIVVVVVLVVRVLAVDVIGVGVDQNQQGYKQQRTPGFVAKQKCGSKNAPKWEKEGGDLFQLLIIKKLLIAVPFVWVYANLLKFFCGASF